VDLSRINGAVAFLIFSLSFYGLDVPLITVTCTMTVYNTLIFSLHYLIKGFASYSQGCLNASSAKSLRVSERILDLLDDIALSPPWTYFSHVGRWGKSSSDITNMLLSSPDFDQRSSYKMEESRDDIWRPVTPAVYVYSWGDQRGAGGREALPQRAWHQSAPI
jgi:hypothetical protein